MMASAFVPLCEKGPEWAKSSVRVDGSAGGPFASRIDEQRQLIPPVYSVRKSSLFYPIQGAFGS